MDVKISEFPTLVEMGLDDALVPMVYQGKNFNRSVYIQTTTLSGLTYTLSLSDFGYFIRKFHSSDHTIIIPSHAMVPFINGVALTIRNGGTGTMTLSASPGVTLNYNTIYGSNVLDANTTAVILKVSDNEWDVV
jgi:hypothetical protein